MENKIITKEKLTKLLKEEHIIIKGNVENIAQNKSYDLFFSYLSQFYTLNINYSSDIKGDIPHQIIIKAMKSENYDLWKKEACFYKKISDSSCKMVVPTCFGTFSNEKTGQFCILLEDLKTKYKQIEWPLPPQEKQLKQTIKSLAILHSSFWNTFDNEYLQKPHKKNIDDFIADAYICHEKLSFYLQGILSNKREKILKTILEKLPSVLWKRISSSSELTLIHGDAHFQNMFFPINKEKNNCIFIDWTDWNMSLGAFDLSYMMALHCYEDYRHQYEDKMLKIYLDELQKNNIKYNWEQLIYDYKLAAAFNLLIPAHQYYRLQIPAEIWWPHIERGFRAFDDLNCIEILK